MRVGEIMKTEVVRIDHQAHLFEAVREMLWAGIRHLPVMCEGRVVGVLSERDILRYRATNRDPDCMQHPVSAAMSRPAQTAHPDDATTEAAGRMLAGRLGCLPVVEQGKIVGIMTTADLLADQLRRAFAPTQELPATPLTAGDVMTRAPLTAGTDDSLSDAVSRMSERGIRHLPVVDKDGHLVGMVGEREIRADVLSTETLRTLRVGSVMRDELVTVKKDATLDVLVSGLADWRLSALPVVDGDNHLLGIISYVDVLRARSQVLP